MWVRLYEYKRIFFVCRCGLGFVLEIYTDTKLYGSDPVIYQTISFFLSLIHPSIYLSLSHFLHALCLYVCINLRSALCWFFHFSPPCISVLITYPHKHEFKPNRLLCSTSQYAINTLLSGVKSFRINVKPLRSYIVFPFEVFFSFFVVVVIFYFCCTEPRPTFIHIHKHIIIQNIHIKSHTYTYLWCSFVPKSRWLSPNYMRIAFALMNATFEIMKYISIPNIQFLCTKNWSI